MAMNVEGIVGHQIIQEKIGVGKPLSVVIEAGHIYTDERPGLTHQIAAEIGGSLIRVLKVAGVVPVGMLFVDDYNPLSGDLNIKDYLEVLREHGFNPDRVVMESSMRDPAERLITELSVRELTKVKKDGKVLVKGEDTILLRKSRILGNGPACDALDAALYIQKRKEADVCLTVLPESYRDQQLRVKKVLALLGEQVPIINIFYNEERAVDLGLN